MVELNVVATGPGGGGAVVVELAEPGSTMGFESPILGFPASANVLCENPTRQCSIQSSIEDG